MSAMEELMLMILLVFGGTGIALLLSFNPKPPFGDIIQITDGIQVQCTCLPHKNIEIK